MKQNEFVAYLGNADFHDACIKAVRTHPPHTEVQIATHKGREITVYFYGVKEVIANDPEGMMIYAFTELADEAPYRRFVFTNWDEEDARNLEIVAKEFQVKD